jgi:hypothetical protein
MKRRASNTNDPEPGETAVEAVAALIREKSASLELVSAPELIALLHESKAGFPCPEETDKSDAAAILETMIREYDDLQMLAGTGPPCFYSLHHMTGTYAKILLGKREDTLRLIAETVRGIAGIYGRPVALDMFTRPPFELDVPKVLDCIAKMAAMREFGDMASTSTSASGIYLYSTLYLEPDRAAMLAEWLDVGQAENP